MRKEEYYMKRLLISLTLVLAMLVVLTSCSKQPTQEMGDAKAAIDSVIADGGEKYANDEVKVLNDELTAAMDEVKVQDGKFIKNYDKAKEMLAKVKSSAETLYAELPARREKAKNDSIAALDAAKTAVSNANMMLAKAPKGKGTKADIEAMRADVSGIEAALTEAQGMIDNEDYLGATDKANSAKVKADEVADMISQAMAKKR